MHKSFSRIFVEVWGSGGSTCNTGSGEARGTLSWDALTGKTKQSLTISPPDWRLLLVERSTSPTSPMVRAEQPTFHWSRRWYRRMWDIEQSSWKFGCWSTVADDEFGFRRCVFWLPFRSCIIKHMSFGSLKSWNEMHMDYEQNFSPILFKLTIYICFWRLQFVQKNAARPFADFCYLHRIN